MTTEIARPTNGHADIVERVLVAGDLARLSPADRVRYYGELCASLHLNPLSKPFEYIVLNGKLQLYALKAATDQLRALHGVSITRLEQRLTEDGIYEVTATARSRDGRTDQDMGAVAVAGLRGEALCNARLKAITKAKRRVTLSICGLGWLDESELDSIPDARRVAVDTTTGEIAAANMPTDMPLARQAVPPWPDLPPRAPVVQPAQRPRSREVPAGKRWSEADLAYFWGNLAALEPKVTPDELHAILAEHAGEPIASLHDWPDLDTALGAVFAARQRNRVEASAGIPDDERGRILAKLDDTAPEAVFAARQNPAHSMSAEPPIPPSVDAEWTHPAGSVEHEWARYTALDARAAAWNREFPEQPIRYADPPRDAPAPQVRAYADGLERRLAKLGVGA